MKITDIYQDAVVEEAPKKKGVFKGTTGVGAIDALGEFGLGVGSAIGRTGLGIGQLALQGASYIPGMNKEVVQEAAGRLGKISQDIYKKPLENAGLAGKAGEFTGEAATFLAPSSSILKGQKVLANIPKLLPSGFVSTASKVPLVKGAAGFSAKAAPEALSAYTLSLAQTGDEEIAKTNALFTAGAVGVLGSLSKVAKASYWPDLQGSIYKALNVSGKKSGEQTIKEASKLAAGLNTIKTRMTGVEIPNPSGQTIKFDPTKATHEQTLLALNKAKQDIFREYTDILKTSKGADGDAFVDLSELISKLKNADVDVPQLTPFRNATQSILNDLEAAFPNPKRADPMALVGLQQQMYEIIGNKQFAGVSDSATGKVYASVTNQINDKVNEFVRESAQAVGANADEYSKLRSQYSSLKSIEGYLAKEVQRQLRQTGNTVADQFAGLATGEVLSGILYANPAMLVAGTTRGFASQLLESLASRERFLQMAFKQLDAKDMGLLTQRMFGGFRGDELSAEEMWQQLQMQNLMPNITKGVREAVEANPQSIKGGYIGSGLNDIKKKDNVGLVADGVSNDLIQEAKRYKSAEDFINAKNVLRGTKNLTEADIQNTLPNIKLKKDVQAKDLAGNPVVIPGGEKLTPYELKGGKVLLQDGQPYLVNKNQFQNIKGSSTVAEGKPFAPELEGLEETVKTKEFQGKVRKLTASENTELNELGGKLTVDGLEGTDKARWNELMKIRSQEVELKNFRGDTRYENYQLPEGKNYKEVLIKAPTKSDTKTYWNMEDYEKWPDDVTKIFEKYEDDSFAIEKALKKKGYEVDIGMSGEIFGFEKNPTKEALYKSSHWEEPNVLAHLRLNDRTYKGKKVTFMEELQSDWAREYRQDPAPTEKLTSLGEKYELVQRPSGTIDVVNKDTGFTIASGSSFQEAQKSALKFLNNRGVPNNPLLKNWQEVATKRALKEAIENDSEYFAWINGEQTSARYNLATYVDDVNWKKDFLASDEQRTNPIKSIQITTKDKSPIKLAIDKTGKILSDSKGNWNEKQIDEVLGKGLADKIMEKDTGTLSGDGLKFGGEWASNLYDKQVKSIVEDLTGQKVEMLDLGLPIEKSSPPIYLSKGDGSMGRKLQHDDLKVGMDISTSRTNGGSMDSYIITDVLGDGKFKAIKKSNLNDLKNNLERGRPDKLPTLSDKDIIDNAKLIGKDIETFDISRPKVTQQAIRLTPEVKARIKGVAPEIKTSGEKYQFSDEELRQIWNKANSKN